jgi:hypothetical protein
MGKVGTTLTGAAAGAGTGAMLGSVVPGIGTAVGAVAGGLIGGAGGYLAGASAEDAANAQLSSADQARGAIDKYYQQAAGYQQPYYNLGVQGAQNLANMVSAGKFSTTPTAYTAPNYQAQQFNFQADPGYAWRMAQGTDAIQNSAAARGVGLSDATQKALARYGQNLASNEYQNAYSRFQDQRNFGRGAFESDRSFGANQNQLNYENLASEANKDYLRRAGIADYGISAAGNLANLSTGAGEATAGIYGNMGNARAAGIIGQANYNQANLNNLSQMGMYYGMSRQPQQAQKT